MLPRTFGKRLRIARMAQGLTARELGKAIGRSERTIFRYEWDRTEPTVAETRKLATLCQVTVGWLVNGEGLPRQLASA